MRLVFVGGASRSGNTLLKKCLGRHPRVKALSEVHYFDEILPYSDINYCLTKSQAENAAEMFMSRVARGYFAAPHRVQESGSSDFKETFEKGITGRDLYLTLLNRLINPSTSLVLDQSPRYFAIAQDLLMAYEGSHFIFTVRDPRAVILSEKKRWRKYFHPGVEIPRSIMLKRLLTYNPIFVLVAWLKSAEIARRCQDRFGSRVICVSYEAFTGSPLDVLRGICSQLDIQFHPEMLQVSQEGSSLENRFNQRGVGSHSVVSWKRDLDLGARLIVQLFARRAMLELGFPMPSLGWRQGTCGSIGLVAHTIAAAAQLPLILLFKSRSISFYFIRPLKIWVMQWLRR